MKPSIPYLIAVLVIVPLGTFVALGDLPIIIKAVISIIGILFALLPCRNDAGGDGGGSWMPKRGHSVGFYIFWTPPGKP